MESHPKALIQLFYNRKKTAIQQQPKLICNAQPKTQNSYKNTHATHPKKLTNLHCLAQRQTPHEIAHRRFSNSRLWVSSTGLAISEEQQSNEKKSSPRMSPKCLQTSLKECITLTHIQ